MASRDSKTCHLPFMVSFLFDVIFVTFSLIPVEEAQTEKELMANFILLKENKRNEISKWLILY